MTTRLLTLRAAVEARGETIKGARFVATAAPLDMNDAALQSKAVIAAARGEHRDAVHHGWAYRVGPLHADFRWSDDGEPVGAAGQPILRRIDALAVLNVVVVVSRWGGGQRLSASDLAKGYGEAARAALTAAELIEFVPRTRVALSFDYVHSGPVQGVLASFHAEHVAADYGEVVQLVVHVASDRATLLIDALADATAGAVRAQ